MTRPIGPVTRRKLVASTAAVAAGLVVGGKWEMGAQADSGTYPYPLGEDSATIRVHQQGSGAVYFAPHDNENTSIEAALRVIGARGGRLVEVVQRGERNISFRLEGLTYAFDPNRIFTDTGIQATLKTQGGGHYSPQAHLAVRAFAEAIRFYLGLANLRGFLIAMHNNSDNNYSVRSYEAGGQYARDADRVYVSPNRDADNFFFVTELELFDYLKSKGYNVVLQKVDTVVDDGSMSVYCAQHGIPYVNIEAQSGHLSAQVEMLQVLIR